MRDLDQGVLEKSPRWGENIMAIKLCMCVATPTAHNWLIKQTVWKPFLGFTMKEICTPDVLHQLFYCWSPPCPTSPFTCSWYMVREWMIWKSIKSVWKIGSISLFPSAPTEILLNSCIFRQSQPLEKVFFLDWDAPQKCYGSWKKTHDMGLLADLKAMILLGNNPFFIFVISFNKVMSL